MMLELDLLAKQDITDYQLFVSDRAHIVFPYHALLDGMQEAFRQGRKIGTTKRGIGPAYMDKADRSGIRVVDLYEEDLLPKLIRDNVFFKNKTLDYMEAEGIDIRAEYEDAMQKVKNKSEEQYNKLLGMLDENNRIDEE